MDASPYFSDPDGDPLTFAAGSSNPDVATETVSGHRVAVLALAPATITVTATDPSGLETLQGFEVTVPTAVNRPPGITATLPDLSLEYGEEHMVVMSHFFADPDGDAPHLLRLLFR